MSDELTDYLRQYKPGPFKPIPVATQNGQAIQWYWEDSPSYSESIHHDGVWIGSVHRANNDRRVVGVTIHCEAIKYPEETPR
jgi:hypothetical protein